MASQAGLVRAGRTLARDRWAVGGAAILGLALLAALLAPWIAPRDPLAVRTEVRLSPPGTPGYPLGTDAAGRDLLSRILWGGRISLLMGIGPVLFATGVGVPLGLVAGFRRGWLDHALMRVMDVLFAFPPILLAIGIASALGPGVLNGIVAMAVVITPRFVRLTRGTVLSIREREYVEAARAAGATERWLMLTHVLPNAGAPVIVYASLETGSMMVVAASLGFLGLGAQPPAPEWGAMLADGRDVLAVAPVVASVPGLAIFLVAVSLNVLGDGLRDAFDPRARP
jgi:ABC-type dipeptide/oligopeptide/nickel transport system permease subunit